MLIKKNEWHWLLKAIRSFLKRK